MVKRQLSTANDTLRMLSPRDRFVRGAVKRPVVRRAGFYGFGYISTSPVKRSPLRSAITLEYSKGCAAGQYCTFGRGSPRTLKYGSFSLDVSGEADGESTIPNRYSTPRGGL